MLKVAPVGFDAADYACRNWHYSGRMVKGRAVKFGVWEDGQFVGAVVYGSGANAGLGSPYGLDQIEVCELVRVALREHRAPVTQIVAETLRQLKASQPGLRLVVSYADPTQGHHGGIYQAGNWLYDGVSTVREVYVVNGRRYHGKAMRQLRNTHTQRGVPARNALEWARKVLDPNATEEVAPGKHRYLMPLDRRMRREIEKRRIAPPGRYAGGAAQTSREHVPGHRPGEAGSVPARRSPRAAVPATADVVAVGTSTEGS